jgi:hypothetical protein
MAVGNERSLGEWLSTIGSASWLVAEVKQLEQTIVDLTLGGENTLNRNSNLVLENQMLAQENAQYLERIQQLESSLGLCGMVITANEAKIQELMFPAQITTTTGGDLNYISRENEE